MADNSVLPATGELIATDELSTINGVVAAAGLKVQRAKVGFGVEGDFNDVADDKPLPVYDQVTEASQQEMVVLLTRMLNYLNSPQGYDKSLQRSRQTTILEAGAATIGTVNLAAAQTLATLTTLANQSLIGGIQAQILPNSANLSAWQASVRARIT